MDLDRKSILQLEQPGRVEHGHRTIFSQSLLRRREHPDLAATTLLQVFGKAIQIQDETRLRRNVLANLVHNEDDLLFARFSANQLDHLLDAIDFRLLNIDRKRLEL